MTKTELYDALLRLCRDYGITTQETYDHLDDAIETIHIAADSPEPYDDPESAPHVGHMSRLGGQWWCDTCDSPYCDLA